MPSIEDCNAEWQSRGRTEIILKFIAVNLSTLTLVAQLGSCLGMPLRSRAWFVARAAILPMWCLVTFYLQILAFVGTMLRETLENDFSPITFLACRAIGMVSTTEVDPPNDEHAVPELPRHIPLSEARCFYQKDSNEQDATDADSTVQFRCRRTKSRWTSQIFNIALTLIYLVQAITTNVLVFRRSNIANKIPHGEPFTQIDTNPEMAVTLFEFQAMLLSMYGVLMSIVYILLQIFPTKWSHVDNRQEWRYASGSIKSSVRRVALGICVLLAAQNVLKSIFEFSGLGVFLDIYFIGPRILTESMMDSSPAWFFLLSILTLAAFSVRWRRFAVRLNHIMGIQQGKTIGLWRILTAFLHTLDYAHQDPTRFFVLGTDDFAVASSSTTTPSPVTGIDPLYLHVGKIVFVYFGLMNFGLAFLFQSSIFEKAEILSTPAVSESGCAFETKLMAWMWKDPLADLLWAF